MLSVAAQSLQEEFDQVGQWQGAASLADLGWTPKDVDRRLKGLEDSLSLSANFESLSQLCGCFEELGEAARLRLLGVVLAGWGRLVKQFDLGELVAALKLLASIIPQAERLIGKTGKGKTGGFDWAHLKQPWAEASRELLRAGGPLEEAQLPPSERDTLVSTLARLLHSLLERQDHAKPLRLPLLDCLALCAIRHGQHFVVKNLLLQDLNYNEHLAEPMAELAALLATQHEAPQLADEVCL